MTRIAVVSTPRSGNTWLRNLLATLTGAVDLAVHTPEEIPWDELDSVILQLHWMPTPALLAMFEERGVRVVSIARHPLDVLVSIVQYARSGKETARWLDEQGGTEAGLTGQAPCRPDAVDYALSDRFAALLGVTPAWWQEAGTIRVTYEDLVADPVNTFTGLTSELGLSGDVEATLAANTLRSARSNQVDRWFHFWKGQPGFWRSLLPASTVKAMFDKHAEVFEKLGYTVDPDPDLTEADAIANWYEADAESLKEQVEVMKSELALMGPRSRVVAKRLTAWRAALRKS